MKRAKRRRDPLPGIVRQYEAELARLHAFTRRLAEHLYLAAEVLSIRAERKEVRGLTVPKGVPCGDAHPDT